MSEDLVKRLDEVEKAFFKMASLIEHQASLLAEAREALRDLTGIFYEEGWADGYPHTLDAATKLLAKLDAQ